MVLPRIAAKTRFRLQKRDCLDAMAAWQARSKGNKDPRFLYIAHGFYGAKFDARFLTNRAINTPPRRTQSIPCHAALQNKEVDSQIIQTISEKTKRLSHRFGKGLLIWLSTLPFQSDVLASSFVLPECSESVVVVEDKSHSKEVILIGTAHISENSANLVRKVIKSAHPDTVMIELDAKRIGRVGEGKSLESLGFVLPKASQQDSLVAVTQAAPKVGLLDRIKGAVLGPIAGFTQQLAGAALGKVLGSFYESVEKLGFTAGGEFQAAVQEAKAIDAKILLGDRDVDVTLQRLAKAISSTDPDQFSKLTEQMESIEEELGIKTAEVAVDKEQLTALVEGLKKKETIGQLMMLVKANLPDVYNALIGERDEFMAQSIAGSDGKLTVAVVGFAHLTGIEKKLTSDLGFNTVGRNCPNK